MKKALKIIVALLFWPITLIYLIWKKSNWKTVNKILGTVGVLILSSIVGSIGNSDDKEVKTVSNNSKETVAIETTIETSPEISEETTTIEETTTPEITTTLPETTTIEETTTSSTLIETTPLFDDVFMYFSDNIGKIDWNSSKKFIDNLNSYDVKTVLPTEDVVGTFTITDNNTGHYIYLSFYPDKNDMETLTLLTYENGEDEISMKDEYHLSSIVYNIFDKSEASPNRPASSLQELINFMFGIDESISNNSETNVVDETQIPTTSVANKTNNISVPYGDVLDVTVTELDDKTILVVKTKITSSWNNKLTIHQNYKNVADIIIKQGGSEYDEIQYWAVADMSDGSESKVVAFTLDKDVISLVKNGNIVDIEIGDYCSDLYILPSLLK